MRSFIRVLIIALFCFTMLASCGGGKEEGGESKTGGTKESSSASTDKARDDVDQEKAKAETLEAAKYASDKWEDAENAFQEAETLYEEKDYRQAKRKYYSARTLYKSAARAAESNKKLFTRYETNKQEALQVLANAEKVKAEEFAPKMLAEAKKKLTEADAMKQDNIQKALSALQSARRSADDALYIAKQKAEEFTQRQEQKKLAEDEKKYMLEKKKMAEEMEAPKKFMIDFEQVKDMIREGDRFFDNEKYVDAQYSYKSAKDTLMSIIQLIQNEPKLAQGTTGPQAMPGPGAEPQPLQPPEEIQPGPGPLPGTEETTPAAPTGSAMDILIQNNLEQLSAAEATYENGEVVLDYTDGDLLKKEARYKLANVIAFGPTKMGMVESRSFQGGGMGGYLFTTPVFRGNITVECDHNMELMGAQNPMMVMHALSTGKQGYGCSFGAWVGVISSGRFKPESGTTNSIVKNEPVKNWYPLGKDYKWKLVIECPKGSTEGTVKLFFDGTQCSGMKIKYREDDPPRGLVGFTWNNCKFMVKNLRIRGTLDPEWAIGTLKKKGVQIPDEALVEAGLKKAPAKKSSEEPKQPGGLEGELDY